MGIPRTGRPRSETFFIFVNTYCSDQDPERYFGTVQLGHHEVFNASVPENAYTYPARGPRFLKQQEVRVSCRPPRSIDQSLKRRCQDEEYEPRESRRDGSGVCQNVNVISFRSDEFRWAQLSTNVIDANCSKLFKQRLPLYPCNKSDKRRMHIECFPS